MSNLSQPNTYLFTTAAVRPRRSLLQLIAFWLQRCWQSECRRAERPDRVVPYY